MHWLQTSKKLNNEEWSLLDHYIHNSYEKHQLSDVLNSYLRGEYYCKLSKENIGIIQKH